MRRPFFRFLLLCLLIATLPLQGHAAGGCCAHGGATSVAMRHCGMAGMAEVTAAPSADPGCAMHAAHHGHQHDASGSCAASCTSCCAAFLALAPALPLLPGAAPVRPSHAAPIVPAGGHIPSGPERPPRCFLA